MEYFYESGRDGLHWGHIKLSLPPSVIVEPRFLQGHFGGYEKPLPNVLPPGWSGFV